MRRSKEYLYRVTYEEDNGERHDQEVVDYRNKEQLMRYFTKCKIRVVDIVLLKVYDYGKAELS